MAFYVREQFLWSLQDKMHAELERWGGVGKVVKPSAPRGQLSSSLKGELHSHRWSVAGRRKNTGKDPNLGMSFGYWKY